MESVNIIEQIKKFFGNKNFVSMFFVSLLSLLIIILIGVGIIWRSRANIFGYFAKEYLQEMQNGNDDTKNAIEKIIEKQSIFSQDTFVIDAVKKTNPAVISIIISQNVPKYETCIDPNQQQQQNPFGDLFPGFNFNFPQYQLCQNGTEKKDIGGGSGFFVSSDGLIVTNKHVVDQKTAEYTVFTNDGKKHTARVIARDPILDIALIKVDPVVGKSFPFLSLGNIENSNSL